MASRLRLARPASRPKMYGRAMLSGPSGSGKTWTSLSIATHLAAFEHAIARLRAENDGADPDPLVASAAAILSDVTEDDILVIDTEKESALTYSDDYRFTHLPWRPPYDPDELADALSEVSSFKVVTVDSFTKFWTGQGGTLDIAGGAIGGWKNARPVQERLVEAVLATEAHIILSVRSKMEYLIEGGKGNQTVTKMGLSPIQDDNLVYEMNVAFDIDMDHRITVTKSRTRAVPVGRMYPAGLESKAAQDYAEWLAGGVPPAAKADIDLITRRLGSITDKDIRTAVKHEFVEQFGMPNSLPRAQVNDVWAWLDARFADIDPTVVLADNPVTADPDGLDLTPGEGTYDDHHPMPADVDQDLADTLPV